MKISVNKLVSLDYQLYADGVNGKYELVEETTPERPLTFIFGTGSMLPKFEESLLGLQEGDKFEFSIEPNNAYGEYIDENVVELERAIFEVDGKFDETKIFVGNVIPMKDRSGTHFQAEIVSISPTHVTLDLNHPLAGDTLHFNGQVRQVREPSSEELATLSGGGCSSGCDSCSDGCSSC
ncbi:MAG: peptidylprolyl isomerase [Paludibacter sp.]|nr:peptidylprolyl isomerase [Paludibacter sp.]